MSEQQLSSRHTVTMVVGVAEGFGAALVGLHYLMKHSYLRMWFESGQLRFGVGDSAGSAGML